MEKGIGMARIVVCAECGEEQPCYAKGMCKRCYNRRWRKANPEKSREQSSRFYEAHREERCEYACQYHEAHREERCEHMRQYHEAHREEQNEYCRQYYEAHREEECGRSRQWTTANPEKRRKNNRRYRARKNNVAIGSVDEAAIYEHDGYMCIYCGATEDLTLDHLIPLIKGGAHTEDNLVVACRGCNSSKGAKALEEWLETRPCSQAWVF